MEKQRVAISRFSLTVVTVVLCGLLTVPTLLAFDASFAGTPETHVGVQNSSFAKGSSATRTNFPTYLYNNGRSSFAGNRPTLNLTHFANPTASWSYTTGGAVYSEPIIEGSTLYVGSGDGYEYALSITNGSRLWSTFLGKDTTDTNCSKVPIGVTSSATYTAGNLVVSGGTDDVYSLNASTGAIEWNYSVAGPAAASEGYYLWASPLVYNNSAYIGISSRCDKPLVPAGILRLALATGAELAYFNTSQPEPNGSSIWASPSLSSSGSTIFVTTGNPYLTTTSTYGEAIIALNSSNLSVESEWQIPAAQVVGDGDFGATPTAFTLPNGSAVVAAENKNGYLYEWSQSSLSFLWRAKVSAVSDDHFSAAYATGRLFVVGEQSDLHGVKVNSTLSAVNPYTGKFIWRDGFSASVKFSYSVPMDIDGLLVVPVSTTLYFVRASNGSVLGSISPGGDLIAPESTADGLLFVTAGSSVYAYPLPLTVPPASATSSATIMLTHSLPLGPLIARYRLAET